ncbi:MAG: hypothetical protein GEU76_13775 [Alphaproteobacteria bacterium]|nr:hypothetical protein [Alphaproteobacteria bacterium]
MGANRSRTFKIEACAVSLQQVDQLRTKLIARLQEAADLEIASLTKKADESDQDFEAFKGQVRDAFKLSVVVHGPNREETSAGTEVDLLDAENVPEKFPKSILIALRHFECDLTLSRPIFLGSRLIFRNRRCSIGNLPYPPLRLMRQRLLCGETMMNGFARFVIR